MCTEYSVNTGQLRVCVLTLTRKERLERFALSVWRSRRLHLHSQRHYHCHAEGHPEGHCHFLHCCFHSYPLQSHPAAAAGTTPYVVFFVFGRFLCASLVLRISRLFYRLFCLSFGPVDCRISSSRLFSYTRPEGVDTGECEKGEVRERGKW